MYYLFHFSSRLIFMALVNICQSLWDSKENILEVLSKVMSQSVTTLAVGVQRAALSGMLEGIRLGSRVMGVGCVVSCPGI